MTLGQQRRSVYYPGIGGIEEPLDFSSAFGVVDADVVHGVDMWDDRDVSEDQKREVFLNTQSQMVRWLSSNDSDKSLRINENDNAWEADFSWRGKSRKLIVNKSSIDATTYIPDFDFNVIYSHRTYRLVTRLPTEVFNQAELLIDQEQYRDEDESVRDWLSSNRRNFEVVKINEKYGDGKNTVARKLR